MRTAFLFLFMLATLMDKAQDTLILNNYEKMLSKVVVIGMDSIRYKSFENPDSADLYIANLDVRSIKLGNGSIINIDSLYRIQHQVISNTTSTCVIRGTAEQMYSRGKSDAEYHYPEEHPVSVGLGVTAAVMGPFGVIPALVIMLLPPSEKRLKYPCREMWMDSDYRKGYKKAARKIKRRRIALFVCPVLTLSSFAWRGILNSR